MSIDRAWRDYTTGRSDTVIAYVEGGINWHAGDAAELANRVYINRGELPRPCAGSPCTTVFGGPPSAYDLNGNGTFNVADYATDPRVADSNGNGLRDPEDLIVSFTNGIDNDANGYRDDISGWDFYTNQNDPATIDTAYTHANGQMKQAAAETNNGVGGAGICPRCLLLPVKAGAEALDRTDDLAEAWLFAADAGASVIVSVTADLGYSSFMRQAVESIWRRGVVMVEASNDFNSTDHQGGMWWPHVLAGQRGRGRRHRARRRPASRHSTTTFRERSNYTSWGTHNMFSVATDGGTTSEATPTVGGVAALLLSHGKNAADQSLISSPLTNAEAIQVLRATVERHRRPHPRMAGQARLGPAVRLRPAQRVEGDAGGVRRRTSRRWAGSTRPTGSRSTTPPPRRPCPSPVTSRPAVHRATPGSCSSRRARSRPTPRSSPPARARAARRSTARSDRST